MNRYALSFTVRAGSEPEVARVLRSYRRPPPGTRPDPAGGSPLLQRTSVFMAGTRVVRVIDVDGDIAAVMRHLAEQPQIQAVEAALDPHLAAARDLRTPDGVRAFLHQALLPATRPAGTTDPLPPDPAADRCALLLPVRTGCGGQAGQALAGLTDPATTTIFRRGDVLVGLLEMDGAGDALDQLALAAAPTAAASTLADAVTTSVDLTTTTGLRAFLADCRMELLTDRRVGVPA